MGSKVPVFDDNIFIGMDLINMDELMTDGQEGFPEVEESFHFGYQERLTIDDSLMQTKTVELVDFSDVMDQSTFQMDTTFITNESVQGLSLPFPVTFSDDNVWEPVTNPLLHDILEEEVVLQMISPEDILKKDFSEDLTLPHATPMSLPVSEYGCAVSTTEIPGAHALSTIVSIPPTKKKPGRKPKTVMQVTSSNADKTDVDPILDTKKLLTLRPPMTIATRKMVPDELKDKAYYEKRSKNRLAARKSRQNKRKLDEGRANLLNSLLEEIEQLKLEIARIKVIEQKYIDLQTQYGLLTLASKPFTSMNIPEGGH
ncbi:unnamed protein product [Orchesella dallaii]|uniref:BZIP domain-containing protein n=1 Tax=Orchesella dallaii TaxID=48710 RepID=A0ABP1RWI2_9HEXA